MANKDHNNSAVGQREKQNNNSMRARGMRGESELSGRRVMRSIAIGFGLRGILKFASVGTEH